VISCDVLIVFPVTDALKLCYVICQAGIEERGVQLYRYSTLALEVNGWLTFWRRNYFFNFSTSCI